MCDRCDRDQAALEDEMRRRHAADQAKVRVVTSPARARRAALDAEEVLDVPAGCPAVEATASPSPDEPPWRVVFADELTPGTILYDPQLDAYVDVLRVRLCDDLCHVAVIYSENDGKQGTALIPAMYGCRIRAV